MAYIATIGFFDGVHTGHQFVLSETIRLAGVFGVQSAVLTFTEHPQKVLRGESIPLLTTYDERVSLLKKSGVDEIFAFNFDIVRDFTAEEFMRVLYNQCQVEILVMGYDHRFGSDRLTDFADYQAAADRVGLQVIPLQQNPDSPASSTKVRKALLAADIVEANALLGYPYTLIGEVVGGKHLGRTIGFPTANIQLPADKLVPCSGVYAVEVLLPDQTTHLAVLNIGNNPTVEGTEQTIEMHIPHFDADLYGQILHIRLLRYIRPEQRFESINALKNQIEKDILQLQTL
ncbi:MAG: riboflavin biosynthesis protein RibF [Paludibacteraceae bacterium]|nr:riboflavin biosynthesis protein RibF [Paludibacteraceae bacterium]